MSSYEEGHREGLRSGAIERRHLNNQIARLRADVAELLDALEDVIYQSCYDDERGDGHLDSMALSAYAKGMRVLSKHGRFEIEAEGGRRVIGKLKQEGGE